MKRFQWTVPVAGLCFVALLFASCGGEESAASTRSRAGQNIELPSQLLGLTVGTEDIKSRVQQADQPFIDSVGLFAFRQGKDLLQATLQVSRFTEDARPESPQFRGSIISRIGGANPREVRIDDQKVYLTSGRNQVVFIWFRDQGFFVLTVRRDYSFPRTIARRLIEMEIEI